MGRKKMKEESKMVSISASFHPSDVDKIDFFEDEVVSRSASRSKKLQHFVNLAVPEGFDRSKLEYFQNAIQAQIGRREIWHALARSSVESFIRENYGYSKRHDVWLRVPKDVKSWFDLYILPLEKNIVNLEIEEINLLCKMAKLELKRILPYNNNL